MGQWVRKRKGRGSELVYVPDEFELAMGLDAETIQRGAAPFETAIFAGGGDPDSQGARALVGSSAVGYGSPFQQSYLDEGLVRSGQIHAPRGTPSIIEAMKLPRDRLGREVEKKKADKRQTVTKTDADGNTTVTVTDTEDLDTVKERESPSFDRLIPGQDLGMVDPSQAYPGSVRLGAPGPVTPGDESYWAGEQFPESAYLGSERQIDNTAHWQQMLRERQMREAMEGYGPRAPAEPSIWEQINRGDTYAPEELGEVGPAGVEEVFAQTGGLAQDPAVSLWEQINRGDTYAPEELGEVGPAGVEEIFGPRPPAAPAEVSSDPRFEMLGQGPGTQMGYPDPSWTAEPPGMSTPQPTVTEDDLPEYGMEGVEEVFAPGPEETAVSKGGPTGSIRGIPNVDLLKKWEELLEWGGSKNPFDSTAPESEEVVTGEEVVTDVVGPDKITGPGDYPTDVHPPTREETEAASGAANTDSDTIVSSEEALGEKAGTGGTEQFDPTRIYAKFDKDIGAEKERYLAEYNKVMKRAMMLNAIAAMTGGKSYADVYVTAAMAKFDKMKGYDDRERLQKIQRGVYWKEDGTFDAPKSKKQAYTRALRFGATAEEAAKIAGWDEAEVAGKQFVNWYNPDTDEIKAVRFGSKEGQKLADAGWARGAGKNDISGTGRERLNTAIQTALDMGSPSQALNALLNGWDTTYDQMGDKEAMFKEALQTIGRRMLRQSADNPAIKTFDARDSKVKMTPEREVELMQKGFKFAYDGTKIERLDGEPDSGIEPEDEEGWCERTWGNIKDLLPSDDEDTKRKWRRALTRGI